MLRKALIICLFLFSNAVFADDTAQEIINKTDLQARKHSSQKFDVEMKIFNSKGAEKKRFFSQKKLLEEGDQKSLISFYKPATVKGTSVLTHNITGKKTQWIYLPALRSVKQLNSSEGNKSFMGSDFNYNDIAGRDPFEDEHILLAETDKYFIIESTPKDRESSYSKLELVIDKVRFVVIRIKFFDKNGELLKILTNKDIKNIKGQYIAIKSEMLNKQQNSKTLVNLLGTNFDKKFTDYDFGVGVLTN